MGRLWEIFLAIGAVTLTQAQHGAGEDLQPCTPTRYLLKFPGNCSKFLACSSAGLMTLDCPEDLAFNEATQVCDYRNFVPGCQDFAPTSPCASAPCLQGTCVTTDASHQGYTCQCHPGYTGPACADVVVSPECPHHQCPADLPGYSYPAWDNLNCSSYYRCERGVLELRACPAGQKFDVLRQTCRDSADQDAVFCEAFRQ